MKAPRLSRRQPLGRAPANEPSFLPRKRTPVPQAFRSVGRYPEPPTISSAGPGKAAMSAPSRAWQDLGGAWRASDWSGCVSILRPLVEELPEVLSTRLLLAGFATRAENDGLALLHYEKLLVLAVGQGELFHALAAERGLDTLRGDEIAHRKRVQALQQWFKTMPPRSRGRRPVALPQSWIVDLPAADFRRYAESAALIMMAPEPAVFESATNAFAVVLHGAARWIYQPAGEAPLPPVEAAAGDVIAAPMGCTGGDRVTIETPEPGVLLNFTGEVAHALRERLAAERRAAIQPRPEPALSRPRPAAAAPRSAEATAARPAPDPLLEPLILRQQLSSERRREHELVVRFAAGEAEIGLAGTRTAAIAGRLAELSPSGLTISVPRAPVRQSRAALEGAHIVTLLMLPDDDQPLRLAARVTRLTFEPRGAGREPRAHLAVEFVLLLAPDRARLQEALIEATRAGAWPWDPGAEPAESRPAA